MPGAEMLTLHRPEDIQMLLDTFNEAGLPTSVSGRDAVGQAFLVHLIGQYADVTNVWVHDPWDYEIEVPEGQKEICENCNPHGPLKLEHLKYPVIVLVALV